MSYLLVVKLFNVDQGKLFLKIKFTVVSLKHILRENKLKQKVSQNFKKIK